MQKLLKQDKKNLKNLKKSREGGRDLKPRKRRKGGEPRETLRYQNATPRHATLTNFDIFVVNYIKYDLIVSKISDQYQYQYLGNCPPTPSLTQQQSIDNKLGLMLRQGRGRWAVAQILILIQNFLLCVPYISDYFSWSSDPYSSVDIFFCTYKDYSFNNQSFLGWRSFPFSNELNN